MCPSSETHRDFARHKHEYAPHPDSTEGLSHCALNQRIRRDLIIREAVGPAGAERGPPAFPFRLMSFWEPLEGRSWVTEYAGTMRGPPGERGTMLSYASDELSYPLTILWALE